MREYILYAILIFLPLGLLMASFLYKQGFTIKQISYFTVAALAAIILFPIIAAKIGTTMTAVIFLVLLALLSWQVMQAEQSIRAQKNYNSSSEQDGLEPLPGETNNIIIDEIPCSKPQPASDELVEESVKEGPGADTIQLACAATADDTYSSEAAANDTGNASDEFAHPSTGHNSAEAELADDSNDSGYDGVGSDSEPAVPAIELVETDNECMETKPTANNNGLIPTEAECGVGDSHQNGPITTETEIYTDTTEQIELDSVENSLDEEATDQPVEKEKESKGQAAASKAIDAARDELEIKNLLDAGFAYKMEGNAVEAARSFEAAYQLTDIPDLKYLLSQELVMNYEILGQYTKAINIMKHTIGSGVIPAAGLDQAQQKLEYLHRMVEELERLGLGEVPVSEVPRLVKLKVGQIY
jgi:hypothetical protein